MGANWWKPRKSRVCIRQHKHENFRACRVEVKEVKIVAESKEKYLLQLQYTTRNKILKKNILVFLFTVDFR